MKLKIISNDFKPEVFDAVAPHPLQSWQWGEARQKMGIETVRIGEFPSDDTLKNVFQITFHPVPYTGLTIGYLPRSVIPSQEVINMLIEEGKKRNAVFIKIEPYIRKQPISTNFNQFQLISNKSSHPLFPSWTQMLDLTKSEEELLKNMKPKTRYNIRLAEKKGVVVREMTNEKGFEIFSRLYFETCRRQSYRGHTPEYHKIVFESLKDKMAHILIAFHPSAGQMTPLASYELFIFNDVLYYPYGGSSEEYRNLMATNLLMWEAIRFGKKSGCKLFDMWGSLGPSILRPSSGLRTNPNNDWIGFTHFKEGYGTEYVEFVGSYDLVLNKALYPLYNLANKIRRKVL